MIATIQEISADFLFKKLTSNDRPVLINTLPKESYLKKRIPGSVNIPSDNIKDWIEKVVPDKKQDIVVYCANKDCDASPTAAKALMEMGYENVWDFEKGLAGWKNAGYELNGEETA